MSIGVVARRYAQATYEVAARGGDLAPWREGMALLAAVARDAEFASFVDNPAVSQAAKSQVVEKLLAGTHEGVRRLGQVLLSNGRIAIAPEILEAFEQFALEAAGVMGGEVVSAVALSDAQRGELEAALAKRFGAKVKLAYRIDPSVLGGVRVQLKDTVIDGTLARRLELLRQRLAAAA